jgi:hypothetical protein
MTSQEEHERGLMLSFVPPERRNRYVELIARPKRRKDITESLAHVKHLDMRSVVRVLGNQSHPSGILQLLKSKGAPEACYALSEDSEIDGREILLSDGLEFIVGHGVGTFLSCIRGKLAYFEDEDQRWILERKQGPPRS